MKSLWRKLWSWTPQIMLAVGVIIISGAYGFAAHQNGWFPAEIVSDADKSIKDIKDKAHKRLPWFYIPTGETHTVIADRPAEMAPGLTLISALGPNKSVVARLVDAEGRTQHEWDLDWFKMWPNPTHVREGLLPKERPGTHLHGVHIAPNGDLTYLYDPIGLMQVDICGRVKWRLPELTHHTIFTDEKGTFWTLSVIRHEKPAADISNYRPPFDEDVILNISADGQVLQRIRLFDVLQQNGREGLMYLSTLANRSTEVTEDDALHTNDVEVFPSTLKPGAFAPGDIMVSMRNINTIIVFDPRTKVIKQMFSGQTVRQHDPDFVDGDTIRVFDNHNITKDESKGSSRIVELTAGTENRKVLFEGTAAHPFFSVIMGRTQKLANGGILVTEATRGRAFELNAKNEIIWQYFNHVEPKVLGLLSDAERIAPDYLSVDKVKQLAASCPVAK
ncbi:arylsulfotransferase family protein [soil metagenome]